MNRDLLAKFCAYRWLVYNTTFAAPTTLERLDMLWGCVSDNWQKILTDNADALIAKGEPYIRNNFTASPTLQGMWDAASKL